MAQIYRRVKVSCFLLQELYFEIQESSSWMKQHPRLSECYRKFRTTVVSSSDRRCSLSASPYLYSLQTDALIQKAIRSMSQSIVITVAHRLKSVIDYDRIIVLQNGHIVELDTPFNLLSNPDGIFTTMCKHAGSREYAELRKAAGLGDL